MRFPPGWQVSADGKRVSRRLRTKDFLAALELFARIGEVAEELEHHPDLHLERWNEVEVVSFSHDEGRLTERDERLVGRLEPLVAAYGSS